MPHVLKMKDGKLLTPFGIRDLLDAVQDYAGEELRREIESYIDTNVEAIDDYEKEYDRMEQEDIRIVARVHALAEKHGCKMSQIALAWQWAKGVASPIVGATKAAYLDDAAGALDVQLTPEDIAALEECYVPHPIVGAINANPPQGVILLDEKK